MLGIPELESSGGLSFEEVQEFRERGVEEDLRLAAEQSLNG
jgi:hypothetical protein